MPANAPHTEHLTCKEERVCFQYRSIQIKRLAESVRLSNKVSLRIDQRGVLCVQVLCFPYFHLIFSFVLPLGTKLIKRDVHCS